MSKSEYKRLNLTIPDVVKVISEHALDEAIEAVKSDCVTMEAIHYNSTAMDTWVLLDEAIKSIDNLKNK